jgi:hypothetical protein
MSGITEQLQNDFDYDISNYTVPEMLSILGITDSTANTEATSENIIKDTNALIDKYVKTNSDMAQFFQDMQDALLGYIEEVDHGDEAEFAPLEKQTKDWYENEILPQTHNPIQKDKVTERSKQIDIYDNYHLPMNREQLGVNNAYNLPVIQDTLNPNLTNTTKRFINLDSQFRQSEGGVESISTDYTLDLSDPLTNVLSLQLYSIQIPVTWYIINRQYGNQCFWITNKNNTFLISIPEGNYGPESFITVLNNIILYNRAIHTTLDPPYFIPPIDTAMVLPVTYFPYNGKICINLDRYTDPSGNVIHGLGSTKLFDSEVNPYFTFFDFTGELYCNEGTGGCSPQNISFTNTLGWLMGYRLPIVPIIEEGNCAPTVIDLTGPKYFILVLDDFNQNHINNGLITITQISTNISTPSYYNASLPTICKSSAASLTPLLNKNLLGNLALTKNADTSFLNISPLEIFQSITDKLTISYGKQEVVLPSAPRRLTQTQLYSLNEIMKNRSKTTLYRGKAPTPTDTFALIPLKSTGLATGELFVDFSGSLGDNKRVYFGPVNIDRMRIKLLDDKGFVVDLHGAEWCITLISENLYQY